MTPGEPERDAAGALLRAGAVPASVVTVICAALAGLDGASAAASAVVGGLLALVAFAVGPLVMRAGARMTPPGLLAAAVLAYGSVVLVLGVAYSVLDLADWFRGMPAGLAVLAVSTAWLAGQLRRTRQLRVLVFGSVPENR